MRYVVKRKIYKIKWTATHLHQPTKQSISLENPAAKSNTLNGKYAQASLHKILFYEKVSYFFEFFLNGRYCCLHHFFYINALVKYNKYNRQKRRDNKNKNVIIKKYIP